MAKTPRRTYRDLCVAARDGDHAAVRALLRDMVGRNSPMRSAAANLSTAREAPGRCGGVCPRHRMGRRFVVSAPAPHATAAHYRGLNCHGWARLEPVPQ